MHRRLAWWRRSLSWSTGDYSAIVDTFVTLEFIPAGTDLKPILPVLAKVFLHRAAGSASQRQACAAMYALVLQSYAALIGHYLLLQVFDQALAGGGAKSINFQVGT